MSTLRISARTPISARQSPLKMDFRDFCWSERVFAVQTHTARRGLCLQGCLLVRPCFKEAPLWLQLKGSVLCPHAGVTRGISASWLSGQSSGLWEAALQPDPGGGTLTPQCLHCGPFSPPASGTTGRTKVKLLPCCLATTGKEAQRGRAEWKKTRFLFSFT